MALPNNYLMDTSHINGLSDVPRLLQNAHKRVTHVKPTPDTGSTMSMSTNSRTLA